MLNFHFVFHLLIISIVICLLCLLAYLFFLLSSHMNFNKKRILAQNRNNIYWQIKFYLIIHPRVHNNFLTKDFSLHHFWKYPIQFSSTIYSNMFMKFNKNFKNLKKETLQNKSSRIYQNWKRGNKELTKDKNGIKWNWHPLSLVQELHLLSYTYSSAVWQN